MHPSVTKKINQDVEEGTATVCLLLFVFVFDLCFRLQIACVAVAVLLFVFVFVVDRVCALLWPLLHQRESAQCQTHSHTETEERAKRETDRVCV